MNMRKGFVLLVFLSLISLFPYTQHVDAASTNISTNATWTDRTINSGDIVTVQSGVTLTITGTLRNYGTINIDGNMIVNSGGRLYAESGSNLNVNSGGRLNSDGLVQAYSGSNIHVNSGGVLSVAGYLNARDDLRVYGTLTVSGYLSAAKLGTYSGSSFYVGTDGKAGISGTINSANVYGTLTVNSGNRPAFVSGVRESGSLTVNSGAIRVFSGGLVDITPGSSLNLNSGSRLEVHGIVKINGEDGDSSLTVNSGTIRVFSGGVINTSLRFPTTFSAGSTSTIEIGSGTITIDSNARINQAGRMRVSGIVDNYGTINVAIGDIDINSGGVMNVHSGGSIDLASHLTGLQISGILKIVSGGTITNAGSITKECEGEYSIDDGGTLSGNQLEEIVECSQSEPPLADPEPTITEPTVNLNPKTIVKVRIIPSEAGTSKFQVAVENKTYDITAVGEGIRSLDFNQDGRAITIENEEEGLMEIDIPKDLLSGNFTVFSNDGAVISFDVTQTDSSSTLLFNRPADSTTITVQGTNVIPEFPVAVFMLAAVGVSAIVILSRLQASHHQRST